MQQEIMNATVDARETSFPARITEGSMAISQDILKKSHAKKLQLSLVCWIGRVYFVL